MGPSQARAIRPGYNLTESDAKCLNQQLGFGEMGPSQARAIRQCYNLTELDA